jgi:hypothetical protein
MIIRRLMLIAGIILVLPVGLLTALAFSTPITPSGALYLTGALLIAGGAITAPWRRTRFRGVVRAGVILLGLVACARLTGAGSRTTAALITLPGGHNARWLDRLVHERDIALFGVQVAQLVGAARPGEYEGLIPALQSAYAAMEKAGQTTSSPFLSTYLGCQRPAAFDTVIVEPAGGAPARTAVVFLHGLAGNFTVCGSLVAPAAGRIGAVTVCPSVGWRGDWWTGDGQQTVRNTLDYLHARGVKRIYLAGISNGAVGVCRLAPRLSSELAGLILISGADTCAPDAGLPMLALQGNADRRMPAALAIQTTRQAGQRGTYREFDADHMLLVKRTHEVQEVLAAWLSRQEEEIDGRVHAVP